MARKGILGTKLGMTQVFDENNRVVPVTVVKAGPNVVTRIRTPERDGYSAVQLAYGEISPRKVTKPVTGQFAAAGVNPRRHLAELRLGVSPRGTIGLARAARAYAGAANRPFVTADDIKELAPLVLAHRMILTPEAELQGRSPLDLLLDLLHRVPVPQERVEGPRHG